MVCPADNTFQLLGQVGRDRHCSLESAVEEDSGHATIQLSRLGSLEQEAGVVCYTEPDTALGGADYISRPRFSPGSEVVFGVNQSLAECRVQILDDTDFEARERFYVHILPLPPRGSGPALADTGPTPSTQSSIVGPSSICVYINYAENDGKALGPLPSDGIPP